HPGLAGDALAGGEGAPRAVGGLARPVRRGRGRPARREPAAVGRPPGPGRRGRPRRVAGGPLAAPAEVARGNRAGQTGRSFHARRRRPRRRAPSRNTVRRAAPGLAARTKPRPGPHQGVLPMTVCYRPALRLGAALVASLALLAGAPAA